MCGSVIIKLNPKLNKFQDIGVILMNETSFTFLSLQDESNQRQLSKILKSKMYTNRVVKINFNMHPVFPMTGQKNILYFVHYSEVEPGVFKKTSIVKMNTHSLTCTEIYSSINKIINLSLGPTSQCNEQVFSYQQQ